MTVFMYFGGFGGCSVIKLWAKGDHYAPKAMVSNLRKATAVLRYSNKMSGSEAVVRMVLLSLMEVVG